MDPGALSRAHVVSVISLLDDRVRVHRPALNIFVGETVFGVAQDLGLNDLSEKLAENYLKGKLPGRTIAIPSYNRSFLLKKLHSGPLPMRDLEEHIVPELKRIMNENGSDVLVVIAGGGSALDADFRLDYIPLPMGYPTEVRLTSYIHIVVMNPNGVVVGVSGLPADMQTKFLPKGDFDFTIDLKSLEDSSVQDRLRSECLARARYDLNYLLARLNSW